MSMKKQLSLLFLMAFALNAFSQPKIIYKDEYAGSWFKKVSNNGRYVVGSNPAYTKAYLVDTKTNEVKIISDSQYNSAQDVTDDGIIVGSFYDPEAFKIYKDIHGNDSATVYGFIVPGIYKNNKWTAVERAADLNGDGWDGTITSISGNGKLMGGHIPYCNPNTGTVSKTKYEPIIWDENGKIIKKLPIYDSSQGAAISSMSDDGNVACGWYDGSQYGKIIIWKDGEKVNDAFFNGSGMTVSPNGKFVGGNCGKGMLAPQSKPFIWSEEGGFTIVDCPDQTNYGYVTGITNDGKRAVGFVDLGGMTENRHPFIIEDGVYYDFDTWMKDKYNLSGPHGSFWAIQSMSADGNVICGIGYYDRARDPWIVVLDESLLPDVSSISTIRQELDVKVAFDAASGILNIEGDYTSASLYNNVGACILSDNQAEGSMNVSHLAEGIYFAKVMKGKTARTFKVAITH